MLSTSLIKSDPLIKKLIQYISRQKRRPGLYIVGGFLRDIFLKRRKDVVDIDFAVGRNAVAFARGFARQIKAGFVVLDKARGCARVVYKTKQMHYTLDFTDFRGRDLKDDMLHRDFTINALALDVARLKAGRRLEDCVIDFHGGLKDIKLKKIRAASESSFKDDPLRVLRAFSAKAMFGFNIDKQTLRSALKSKEKLRGVSYERIRDELFKIFESENACKTIKELDDLKILYVVLPQLRVMRGVDQGPYHHLDVWGHSLEALKQFEALLKEIKRDKKIGPYLGTILSPTRSRLGLLKFACLLHDIGKPESRVRREGKIIFHGHERCALKIVRGITEMLKLSQDEYYALKKIVFWHLRPGYLADIETLSERARFRFFRDTAEEAVSVLLLAIADQRATRGPLTAGEDRRHHEKVCLELAREFFIRKGREKIVRLIDGNDLIKILKLTPSPIFSKILDEVEEAQAAGEITTKKQALALARSLAKI
ncbi:MAG: HD domain-containing protein [Candidatus Omnitrophica bacterium]|nr:HD domain-containing protein [Candidatus Omnitrophota bacterium]